jgi:hypothetical protein
VFSRIPHVLRGLDRWDEFENDIANPNNTDYGAENIVENMLIEENRAEEEINCEMLDSGLRLVGSWDAQMPRPMKENIKDAYLDS